MSDFQRAVPFSMVRLHALRAYYSLAGLVERHSNVHLTINLTPVLLRQIENYVERGFTDRALESTLGSDPEICTVTFSEFLKDNPGRGVKSHSLQDQERVCNLAHASWIDEYGSRPGNDLGTWIGEPEENAAWDLLRGMRELFRRERITSQTHPQAFEALYAAQGSDWFWWYGDDQTCDAEPEFDDLFRYHPLDDETRSTPISGLHCSREPADRIQGLVPAYEGRRNGFLSGECGRSLDWRTSDRGRWEAGPQPSPLTATTGAASAFARGHGCKTML